MLRMVSTNLMGPIRVTKAFISHFRERHAGLFINTTSIGGLISGPIQLDLSRDEVGSRGLEREHGLRAESARHRPENRGAGGMKTDFFTRSFDVARHPRMTH
jgi:NAD(P)-dependent dehydrogenase (short-subunit alcohol dehydrogenase family)